jgi:hypothetical protein
VEGRLSVLGALLASLTAAGCGMNQPAAPVVPRNLPLPTAGVSGREITVYPLTLMVADDALDWGEALGDRRSARGRADSRIAAILEERAPEVVWVWPDKLRRAARQAPGLLADPDRVATYLLASGSVVAIPDPLWSQMRTLTGVAGDRFALVPAALIYRVAADSISGEAELTLVLVDVRTGAVGWRSVMAATGSDPWSALRAALKALFPTLP